MRETEILIFTGIFVILVCCISTALKRSFLFSGAMTFWLSLSVSLLCIIAMFGLSGSQMPEQSNLTPSGFAADPKPSSNMPWDLPTLLIPYAALGISILAVLLLMLISKLWELLTKGKKTSAVSIDRLVAKQHSEFRHIDKLHKTKKEPALENQDDTSDREYK